METIQNAVKEFLNHCKFEKNLSGKTLKAYETDLRQLFKFLQDKQYSLVLSEVTKTQLREHLGSISSLKPKSIKRKIATIRAMFNFLEFEEKIEINPVRKMRIKIKEPRQLPKALDITEIKEIFDCVYKQEKTISDKETYAYSESLRNIVVVELLFATGARVSEISYLKPEQMNLTLGGVVIKGKGDKERHIELCNPETLRILTEYESHFESRIQKSGYFLTNRFGNRLSDQSIRNLIKNLSEDAGLQKRVTPHTFRHTVATLLLEKDVDLRYIQMLLGHGSIVTTQIYTQVNRAKQREILSTKHPRMTFSKSTM